MKKNDIIMVAHPATYRGKPGPFKTLWLSAEAFWQNEELATAHDETLWQAFHTHGKYAQIVRQARWFVVAVDTKGRYVSSAFVVSVGKKWLLEYVMTSPQKQGKGAGSALIHRLMAEAKKRSIHWVILNCDPKKNNGQLPKFYGQFGFKAVA